MLDIIPPEILTHIAFHYITSAKPQLQSPLPLLLLNKSTRDSLDPKNNPELYARVFREVFDTTAVERRCLMRDDQYDMEDEDRGFQEGEGSDEEHEEIQGTYGVKRIAANRLSAELFHRVRKLAAIRNMVDKEDLNDLKEEDVWVLYIMLIENDGKNTKHLLGPGSIQLDIFLTLCHGQHLFNRFFSAALPSSPEDIYPPETPFRSLLIWLFWLTSGYFQSRRSTLDPPAFLEAQNFLLRPYVFAAHKYDICFASWTLPILPIPITDFGDANVNPFAVRVSPRPRGTTIWWYGTQITISIPMLTHAAILLFFNRNFAAFRTYQETQRQEDHAETILTESGGMNFAQLLLSVSSANDVGGLSREGDSDDSDEERISLEEDEDIRTSQPVNLLSHSRLHDLDFDRLRSCYDSTRSPGLSRRSLRNTFGGCWEGTFSFFDFDAYALMLTGQARALYEGPYGEQAQVWKLHETWVRPIRNREDFTASACISTSPPSIKSRKGKGKGKTKEKEVEPSGLPAQGPMLNAGLPTGLPSTTRNGLQSVAAEAIALENTILQQIEALPGYERVPDDKVDDFLADPIESHGMEMILTGTGHSAWGRFILKGRVRAWDGLASLVKEYAVSIVLFMAWSISR